MYHMKKYIMHQMIAPLLNYRHKNNTKIRAGLYIFKKKNTDSFRREVFSPIFSSVNRGFTVPISTISNGRS